MTESIRVAVLGEDGKIDRRAIPGGVGGTHFDWFFPGVQAAANHDAYVVTPPAAVWGASRMLVAVTASLSIAGLTASGTLPAYRVAVLADGVEVASATIASTSLTAAVALGTPAALPAGVRLNVAVTLIGGSGTYTPGKDLTVSLWVE